MRTHTLRIATLATTAVLGLSAACATTPTSDENPTTKESTTMDTRTTTLAALEALFVDFDADAARPLLAPDYIQHNPGVPTGAEPVLGFLPALKDAGLAADTHRMFIDGDYAVLHSTYTNADAFGAPTLVAFDVFRVSDGKLAEHWDNLQAPPATTASGRSMTDGPTEVVDLDKTDANKALVQGFVDDVLLGGQFDKLPEYVVMGPGEYLQHNPMVGDGVESLGAAITAMAENGQAMSYTKVHKVLGQGNFVLTMSEGALGDTPTAFYDLFRVADGKIVEHWDVIAPIPAEMAHENGKF